MPTRGELDEALVKLTDEQQGRVKAFLQLPLVEQARRAKAQGEKLSAVMAEELSVINGGQFPEELAGIGGAQQAMGFLTRAYGPAFQLVATEDEIRLATHAFWLEREGMKHDA